MSYSFLLRFGGTDFSRFRATASGLCFPVSAPAISRGCLLFTVLLLMVFLVPGRALAAELKQQGGNPVEQLQQQSERHLLKRLQHWCRSVGLQPLKTRVEVKLPSGVSRLPRCEQAPDVETVSDSAALWGQISLRAECHSPQWQLVLRAQVEVEANLPVLRSAKRRGDVITKADTVWQWQTLSASDRGLVTRETQLLGKQVVRRIRAGTPIKLKQLESADWVTAGQQVVIEAKSPGFVARMQGQALENGSEGEAIRVKNLSSGKVITAYPIAPGVVETRF
ncbi:flagellar basal body P-ring formation chaperone FlgA [Shewanella submarina]|uniref:Flagella basal body P-ring formation protein FlgA n=1 Tax=Shewanella submarina TaxID=2016376 RepID=A0ABV7GC66_9GAMM|nr:flagellar basal body P-ring formation chaperone FlgA [Shewanella submarina]MCL1038735.1 flagellar basal body P-ring formation chaperone FlgA [Shewanella submarina]